MYSSIASRSLIAWSVNSGSFLLGGALGIPSHQSVKNLTPRSEVSSIRLLRAFLNFSAHVSEFPLQSFVIVVQKLQRLFGD